MAAESKSLIPQTAANPALAFVETEPAMRSRDLVGPLEVELVFALIMTAVWTPQGRVNAITSLVAALCILWFTVRGRYSARELGLVRPLSGILVILVCGAVMVMTIVIAGS